MFARILLNKTNIIKYKSYKVKEGKMKIRYFDHAATTAVKEKVLKEMFPYFNIEYGNASSLYSIRKTI